MQRRLENVDGTIVLVIDCNAGQFEVEEFESVLPREGAVARHEWQGSVLRIWSDPVLPPPALDGVAVDVPAAMPAAAIELTVPPAIETPEVHALPFVGGPLDGMSFTPPGSPTRPSPEGYHTLDGVSHYYRLEEGKLVYVPPPERETLVDPPPKAS